MIARRQRHRLGQHVAGPLVGGGAELVEGGEEMVVAGFTGDRHEGPHREGVDRGGIESGVLDDLGQGRPVAAAGPGAESVGLALDAQAALAAPGDQALGIDRARQVVVQVTALGKAAQEGEQQRRLIADLVEIAGRAGVRHQRCHRRLRRRRRGAAGQRQGGNSENVPAFHASLPNP